MRPRSKTPAILAIAAALAALVAGPAWSAGGAAGRSGTLDRGFAGRGFLLRDYGSQPGRGGVKAVAGSPSGDFLVLTDRDTIGRYLPDGELDPTFAEGGFLALGPGGATAVAAAPDGGLFVAGFGTGVDAASEVRVTRFGPGGDVDRSFGVNGSAVVEPPQPLTEAATAIFLEPNGRTLLFSRVNAERFSGVEAARLNANGSLDRSYGKGGFALVPTSSDAVSGPLRAFAFDAGELTVALGDTAADLVIRVGVDGRLDPTFGHGGKVKTSLPDGANVFALQPDGRMLIGGEGTRIVRLLPDGSPDPTFGEGGVANLATLGDARTTAIALAADGSIMVAGTARIEPSGSFNQQVLARLTPAGVLDPAFGAGRGFVASELLAGSSEEGAALVPLAGGGTLLAGSVTPAGAIFPFEVSLARFDDSGSLDPAFGDGGAVISRPRVQASDTANALVAGPDGRLTIAARGAGQVVLSRFLIDGRPDPGFGAGGIATATVGAGGIGAGATSLARAPDGRLLVGSGSDAGGAVLRFGPEGRLDPSFGEGGVATVPGVGQVLAVAASPDGGAVVAGLSREPCEVRLTRLGSGGAVDPGFGAGGSASFGPFSGTCPIPHLSLVLRGDGRILLGGTMTYSFLVETSPGGMPAPDFRKSSPADRHRSHIPAVVRAVALDRRGRIIVAGRSRSGMEVTRLTAKGLDDPTFGGDGTVEPRFGHVAEPTDIAIGKDGGLVLSGRIGVCRPPCRESQAAIFALNSDGSLDHRFGDGGLWTRRFGSDSRLLAVAREDGGIVAAGTASRAATARDVLVVRLRG